jgi:hypothetical protein
MDQIKYGPFISYWSNSKNDIAHFHIPIKFNWRLRIKDNIVIQSRMVSLLFRFFSAFF